MDVKPGRKTFAVVYNPEKIGPEQILSASGKAGEEARLRPPPAASTPAAELLPADAIQALLAAFEKHRLVALGAPPRLEEEHTFLQVLIRHPAFPAKVNDLVVDFGNSRYQGLLDRYLAGEEVSHDRLRSLWRDHRYSPFLTWDAPVYERFFAGVRAVNETLPVEKRLRVLLSAPPIDWSNMRTEKDLQAFHAAFVRDKALLAAVIEREVLDKGRRALIIAASDSVVRRNEKNDIGQLEKRHPGAAFVVLPHLGFAERNAELEARLASWPKASLAPLKGTWLGALYEDEFTFEEVADAYLYLGPSESLTASHPPPAVYTDEAYFKELQRRYRVQAGPGAEPLDRARFLKAKPRRFIDDSR